MRQQPTLASLTALLLFLAGAAVAQPAHAVDLEVGARVAGNWNLLPRPTDPPDCRATASDEQCAGEPMHPTLVGGSAFSGFGFAVGPSVGTDIVRFFDTRLHLTAELLYSYQAGTGHMSRGNSRQIVRISTHTLRVPVLVSFASLERKTGLRLGAGLDLILGLSSQSEVTYENLDITPQPLMTRPKTQVAMTLALGLDYYMRRDMRVPFEFRATFNPFVPNNTRERLEGFQDYDNLGKLGVAFTWQLMFVTGVDFAL